jgi:hypothetical protein
MDAQLASHLKRQFKESGSMPGIGDKDEAKRIIKEALKEWMDDRFADFGRWSFGAIMAAVFAALTYFMLWANGWHK